MPIRPRVLIISENVSMRMGGEASLPFYYAKLFEARDVEVWIACHERVRDELREAFGDSWDRVCLVRDTALQKLLFRAGKLFPSRVRELIIDQVIHLLTQVAVRREARDLVRRGRIDVVFEPSPITPKGVSFAYGLGAPVVIGPLCGGLEFPPAFRRFDSGFTRTAIVVGRGVSNLVNRLFPGKLRADVLLVANDQTASALPRGCRGRVVTLIESGVDLAIWSPDRASAPTTAEEAGRPVRFVFSGRFVDWKGIQYLVPAFERALRECGPCQLDLIGGGELFDEVKAKVEQPALRDSVELHGWISRPEAARIVREADVFVMPSLRECGGTAILEAMALGKPVIATNWAGPGDYINETCGIAVDPISEEGFIAGLADAIVRLARSPELRARLGAGGLERVRQENLEWGSKADRVLEILGEVTGQAAPAEDRIAPPA